MVNRKAINVKFIANLYRLYFYLTIVSYNILVPNIINTYDKYT